MSRLFPLSAVQAADIRLDDDHNGGPQASSWVLVISFFLLDSYLFSYIILLSKAISCPPGKKPDRTRLSGNGF
jgi:hypothetical protein